MFACATNCAIEEGKGQLRDSRKTTTFNWEETQKVRVGSKSDQVGERQVEQAKYVSGSFKEGL